MPAIQQETVKVRGELLAWRDVRGGWGFGELSAEPRAIKFTGTLVSVRVGDSLELTGRWVESDKYGRQLKVTSCTPVRAEGASGAVKWMSSRFPDVGLKRAQELVATFGDELWNVIEHDPKRLAEVKGITLERAIAIGAAYLRFAGERDDMVTLRGWGLTDSQIAHCLERWESLGAVISKLRGNPYLLAQEVHGFGFKRADEVARAMGVRKDAPERIRAGVEYVLSEAEQKNGHVYLPGRKLQEVCARELQVDPGLVAKAILAVAETGRIVRRGWRIYTRRMDAAERQCADGLRRLLGRSEAA